MKAEIKELSGKYYGTEIIISKDGRESSIKIWTGLDYEPSFRELIQCVGCNSEYKYEDICRECFCDSHYESQIDYNLSKIICEAINKSSL